MEKTVADVIAAYEPKDFAPFPSLAEANAQGKPRLTIVVSCMDPRASLDKFIDMNTGSRNGELIMQYRNAGGNIRFAVRDILLIDNKFVLDEVVIVHHTDCGSSHFTEEWLREAAKSRLDPAHWDEIDAIHWGANTDMAESVRADLEWLRANKLIRDELKNTARGFLFDIKTGQATEVKLD